VGGYLLGIAMFDAERLRGLRGRATRAVRPIAPSQPADWPHDPQRHGA